MEGKQKRIPVILLLPKKSKAEKFLALTFRYRTWKIYNPTDHR